MTNQVAYCQQGRAGKQTGTPAVLPGARTGPFGGVSGPSSFRTALRVRYFRIFFALNDEYENTCGACKEHSVILETSSHPSGAVRGAWCRVCGAQGARAVAQATWPVAWPLTAGPGIVLGTCGPWGAEAAGVPPAGLASGGPARRGCRGRRRGPAASPRGSGEAASQAGGRRPTPRHFARCQVGRTGRRPSKQPGNREALRAETGQDGPLGPRLLTSLLSGPFPRSRPHVPPAHR